MMLLPGPLMVVLPCLLVNELLDFSRNEAFNLLQCLVVSFNGKLVTTGVVAFLATSFTIAANWRPQVALEQSKQKANELLSNCSGNHSRDTHTLTRLFLHCPQPFRVFWWSLRNPSGIVMRSDGAGNLCVMKRV